MRNKMTRFVVLFVLLTCLFSCSNTNDSFSVIYKVEVSAHFPVTLYINYVDSTGYVQVTTTDKLWTKEVAMPQNGLASLLAYYTYASDDCLHYYQEVFRPDYLGLHPSPSFKHSVSGEIYHPHKRAFDRSEGLVLISLHKLNCEKNIITRLFGQ